MRNGIMGCWLDCYDADTVACKLKVHHNARQGARYVYRTDIANLSNKTCIAFSNMRIDAAVSAEVAHAVLHHWQ